MAAHPDTLPEPAPQAGEVRVRIRACGLNPVDIQTMRGGNPNWSYPHVLGLDGAGVVDAVGEGVTGVAVGDRVAFHGDLRRPGALAEFAVVDARALAHIPDGVNFEAAAALPCAGMTAYQAIHRRLHVAAGDTVLISAGAGGVGSFAVQLAKAAGARVLAVASAENHAYLTALGADACIDYRQQDVVSAARDLTGGDGVDGVVDAVSAASASALVAAVRHGGGVVSIAGRASADAVAPFTAAPSLHEVALGAAHAHGDDRAVRDLAVMLEDLLGRVAAGTFDPCVAEVVAGDEVPAAWARMAEGHTRGKVVATLPGV